MSRPGEQAERERGDEPARRDAWFRQGRQVKGESAASLRLRAYRQKQELRRKSRQLRALGSTTSAAAPAEAALASAGPVWQSLGPAPLAGDVTNFQNYGYVTGRTTAIAVDPADPTGNTVYIGGAYGGVWRSVNAANPDANAVTWMPLLDDQATLAVGAIAVHPTNPNILLVGTGEPHNGDSYYGLGVLRSADAGQSWTLIQSADSGARPFRGLAFSRIAFHPTNPNLVVATTVATPHGGAAVCGGAEAELPSAVRGIYYSLDAGQTWRLANVTDGGVPIPSASTSSVVYQPASNRWFAAIRFRGIYSSTDGINWSRLANQPTPNEQSTAGCPTSQQVTTTSSLYRGELAVRENSNEIYLVAVSSAQALLGIFRTSDGGANWTNLGSTGFLSPCPLSSESGCGTQQAGFNLTIAALPSGSTTDLYVGAVNLFKCTLAANSLCAGWTNLTRVYGCHTTAEGFATGRHVHPDQHAIAYVPNSQVVYFGNDGGIYRTLQGNNLNSSSCSVSQPFDNLNRNMGSMTQFVWFSQHPTESLTFLGGTQDNGSPAIDSGTFTTSGPVWRTVNNGDGGYNAIDPANGNVWYSSNNDINIYRCTAGSGCDFDGFTELLTNASLGQNGADENSSFYPPYLLDPQNPARLILGTCRVWRGPATGSWTTAQRLSNKFSDGGSGVCSEAEATYVSALDAGGPAGANGSQVIYAGLENGRIFVTTNADAGAASWSDRSAGLPANFKISAVLVDRGDGAGNTAYAAVMGFGVGHVFKTTNAGVTWVDISGNLPDAPADALALDPVNPSVLYVGTDVGVFMTNAPAAGAEFSEFGEGFPNVFVTRLAVFDSGGVRKLRASTYGRGIWEAPLASTLPPAIGASSESLAFPATIVGITSTPVGLTIRNNGATDMTVASVASSTPEFTLHAPCTVLAPGARCVVNVWFKPQETGTRSGAVTIMSNAAGSPHVFSLAGPGANFALSRMHRPVRSAIAGAAAASAGASYEFSVTASAELASPVELQCTAPRGYRCTLSTARVLPGDPGRVLATVRREPLRLSRSRGRLQSTPPRAVVRARSAGATRTLELY